MLGIASLGGLWRTVGGWIKPSPRLRHVPPFTDDSTRLSDGRELAYAEWGKPQGRCVFLFHGTPHSRLWCPDEAVTASSNVRLITVDRPGIGGSDILPQRTLGAWASDVAELADALRVEKFGVVGYSAGGAYAAACAARILTRLTGVGIVCSRALSQFNIAENPSAGEELEPDDRQMLELAERDPNAAARAAAEQNREWVQELRNRPEAALGYEPPAGDRWFFEDGERRRPFFDAVRESVRQGPEAFAWELIDAWLPWGFRVADIATEVHLWHGAQDPIVERRHVDFVVQTLPNARLTVWNDSGHLGVARHWGEILEAVTAR
jgi:pimeloyl-ACP methyl ester carboxylesterase